MRAVVLLLVLAACPPRPPVPPDPARGDACEARAELSAVDICDGFFTVEGRPCARCKNVSGCVASDVGIYCASGPCALDPACAIEPSDGKQEF